MEKVVALTDRARNEPRDLYDVWYLTSDGHVDLAMLTPEIDSKLEYRGRTRDGLGDELARKEKRYKKLGARDSEFAISDHGGDAVAAGKECGMPSLPQGAKALWGRSAEDALGTYRRWLEKRNL